MLALYGMSTKIDKSRNLFNREDFIEGVRKRFPESLKEMYGLEDELLHIDMSNFARTTETAIEVQDIDLAKDHLNFMSEMLSRADPDLINAINVSYLEHVFLFKDDPRYTKVRKMLPENLAKELIELGEHFEKLAKRKNAI